MGQDKALIQVEGVPLLQRVCQIAQQCAEPVYVVTPWVERYRDILDQRFHLIQEVPLPGEMIWQGPLVGFAQGLAQVQTDWVLLLACDLPQLQVEILRTWIYDLQTHFLQAGAEPVTEERMVWLPKHPDGWWEPLCGFYDRRCLTALEAFIGQGGRSFQRWLARQSVQELPLTIPQMLFNCNTPEDLERVINSGIL